MIFFVAKTANQNIKLINLHAKNVAKNLLKENHIKVLQDFAVHFVAENRDVKAQIIA
jgi:hypothetical protein